LPVCYEKHWTLYVVNYSSEQIDTLDSLNCTKPEKAAYHKRYNSKIRTGLYDALQIFTENKMKPFYEWGFPYVYVSTQEPGSNDCAFFVMMFSKLYDVDGGKHRSCYLEQVICLPIYSSLIDLANHLT